MCHWFYTLCRHGNHEFHCILPHEYMGNVSAIDFTLHEDMGNVSAIDFTLHEDMGTMSFIVFTL